MSHGQNAALAWSIGVPLATVALGVWGAYAAKIGPWLAAKTHSEQLGQIAMASGGVAAKIAAVLATLPAGADIATVRNAMVDLAATNMAPAAAGAMGLVDPKVAMLIHAELGKMPVAVTAPMMQMIPSVWVPSGSTVPAPVSVAAVNDPTPNQSPQE